MFKTLTARYPGICRRCRQPITIGDRIRYGGPGRTYHLKADCPTTQSTEHFEDRAEFSYDGPQMGYRPTEDF